LEDIKLIEYLKENNIYINDVDFTRDFGGVINKQDFINYLLDNGFRMEGDVGNYKESKRTIKNNNNLVGNSCVSFVRKSEDGTMRYKIYNKFIQSMESAGVRKSIGNHILHWTNNPEIYLKEAIYKSLDTGLLRLEITF
jgi:hypothetical protein